jgi:hypothetical protein
MRSEILEEVWRNRDELAARHNYNLDAIIAELQEIERLPGSIIISRETEVKREDSAEDARSFGQI